MSIVTYPLNGITYDAADAETYLCTRTSGIFSAEDCFNYSLTGDLEITVGEGIAWIRNATFKGKSICSNAATALTISLGNSYNPRIDRVVLEFTAANSESTLKIIEGTPAASPAAPDIMQSSTVYQLGLYEIYVARAATAVTAANITDTRLDETVCGLMRDSVESIPTAELYAQFLAWFESVREFLAQENTAANSLMLEGYPASYFATKAELDIISRSATFPASGTALAENTIYEVSSDLTDYTFTSPGDNKWAHGTFYTGDSPNITFNPNRYLTEDPVILANRHYEFDVYDGVWAVTIIV